MVHRCIRGIARIETVVPVMKVRTHRIFRGECSSSVARSKANLELSYKTRHIAKPSAVRSERIVFKCPVTALTLRFTANTL